MVLALGVALLSFAAWAVTSDNRPAMGVVPGVLGVAYTLWAAMLLTRRERR